MVHLTQKYFSTKNWSLSWILIHGAIRKNGQIRVGKKSWVKCTMWKNSFQLTEICLNCCIRSFQIEVMANWMWNSMSSDLNASSISHNFSLEAIIFLKPSMAMVYTQLWPIFLIHCKYPILKRTPTLGSGVYLGVPTFQILLVEFTIVCSLANTQLVQT